MEADLLFDFEPGWLPMKQVEEGDIRLVQLLHAVSDVDVALRGRNGRAALCAVK